MATTPRRRALMTFGIIRAAIALVIVVGVLFVMPLLTAPRPSPQTQSSSPPQPGEGGSTEEEEEGRLIGQEMETLKQQDPQFARFDQMMKDCTDTAAKTAIGLQPEPGSPSMSVC